MAGEQYRHIFLSGPTRTQGFTSPRRGGGELRIPSRHRVLHSTYLLNRLQNAWEEADQQRRAIVHVVRQGAYFDFVSEPGFDLLVQSLEAIKSGIRLLNVRKVGEGDKAETYATVYVPVEKRGHFLRKIEAYVNKETKSGKPRNQPLVDSITDMRLSVLESFWQEKHIPLPGDDPERVEVWLSCDQKEVIDQFSALLLRLQIGQAEGVLKFPERAVLIIQANRSQLEQLIHSSDDIAVFRAAKAVASFFIELENENQLNLVRDILNRTSFEVDTGVVVCILDHGVNNGHLLIQQVLDNDDLHTVYPDWGIHDHHGHGTLMAGMIAYGDLLDILNSNDTIRIVHRLESAKILPPGNALNPKELWGYMTAQGISLAEIQAPHRHRIICMAISSTEAGDRGRPSSWSAEIDALASGYEDDNYRLIVISAGNVEDAAEFRNYPESNKTHEIYDPGQAWNALTVGAFTEKVQITDPTLQGYTPIAAAGGLSPYSTTSTTWPERKWPIKPDVVFEGGNVAQGPNDSIFEPEDLKILSTYYNPQVAQFAPFFATSAACAQAAWMAAQIQARYPDAWPETVRALIVHTSDWTDSLKSQFLPPHPTKSDYAHLLRICGYGVPNLDRALYCASNSLTLISQSRLQPFDKRDGRYVTHDMHLYNLPWPSDILSDLAEMQVKMRITLSYFIEPGPGEVGWDHRYRYASHGLRFAVNGPSETEHEFIQRVNIMARDEGEHPGTEGPGDKWIIGDARNVGSIHSDIWQGQAAELATSNKIAVSPAVGWWRERKHLKRWDKQCRYSLIVSIGTLEQDIDIYTPVATQLGITVPIAT